MRVLYLLIYLVRALLAARRVTVQDSQSVSQLGYLPLKTTEQKKEDYLASQPARPCIDRKTFIESFPLLLSFSENIIDRFACLLARALCV